MVLIGRHRLLASLLCCASFLALSSTAARAEERVITLETAVRQASARHPSLQAAREGDHAQRARVAEARAGYMPTLGYGFSYTRRTANCVNNPGSFSCSALAQPAPPYQTFNFFQANITLNQTLYDFGRTGGGYDAAKEGAVSTHEQILTARLNVVLDAKVAYYGVLAQQELVKVAEENLQQQKKHLEQAQGFFAVGTKTKIDVAQSEADFANAEIALIRARANLATSKLTLLAAMGEYHMDLGFSVKSGENHPVLPEESAAANAVGDDATKARPDIRSLEAQARQQDRSVGVAKAGYWPVLALQFGPSWAGTEINHMTTNVALTLSLSMPIGNYANPYFTYHQVDEFRATARATRANADKLRNDVRVEAEGARLTLIAAKQAVAASERALVAAGERHKLAEGRYQTGAGNIIELSDAQAALTQAKAARVQADYDVDVARARLAKAIGRE